MYAVQNTVCAPPCVWLQMIVTVLGAIAVYGLIWQVLDMLSDSKSSHQQQSLMIGNNKVNCNETSDNSNG